MEEVWGCWICAARTREIKKNGIEEEEEEETRGDEGRREEKQERKTIGVAFV